MQRFLRIALFALLAWTLPTQADNRLLADFDLVDCGAVPVADQQNLLGIDNDSQGNLVARFYELGATYAKDLTVCGFDARQALPAFDVRESVHWVYPVLIWLVCVVLVFGAYFKVASPIKRRYFGWLDAIGLVLVAYLINGLMLLAANQSGLSRYFVGDIALYQHEYGQPNYLNVESIRDLDIALKRLGLMAQNGCFSANCQEHKDRDSASFAETGTYRVRQPLNLREQATTGSAKIAVLAKHTRVEALARQGDWLQVNAGKHTGWVSSLWLERAVTY